MSDLRFSTSPRCTSVFIRSWNFLLSIFIRFSSTLWTSVRSGADPAAPVAFLRQQQQHRRLDGINDRLPHGQQVGGVPCRRQLPYPIAQVFDALRRVGNGNRPLP